MPLTPKKIGVLMGGDSAEAEVSMKTGTAILKALLRNGYDAVQIPMSRSICALLEKESIEIVFNGLHGKGGEDGTIQGLLETLGIPYTGSGVLSSALGMDKVASRKIFMFHRLPVPEFFLLSCRDQKTFAPSVLSFGEPWVVKPCREGSSVGVSIVENQEGLQEAFTEAFLYDSEILIEPYIRGRELQVGILEDSPLGIIEIRTQRKFYDYTAKYVPGMSEHIYPAPLPEDIAIRLMQLGLAAHRAIGCEGYSRVDFLLDRNQQPFLLEVNTLPGMTETSLLPEIARGAGISFDRLVERILSSALQKK
ncbi:MAG: D-alanine--D-alanine ligase [Nitrospirae bacterium]|nr:D-alanine--D-alanine ligase [Nitrospirota bacterium]MBI3593846.1 D-alanine--D-alanine ligase [Nitrospirota bacterium]